MKEKIGQKLVSLELLSFEQAELVLQHQKKHPDMKFGEIALELGFISPEDLEDSLTGMD